MGEPVRRIVIVGGGTAGWLSACVIAARLGSGRPDALDVTVIEAPNIATVGVGEGTWPTMRGTLSDIGIDEAEFLACCDASPKQGSRFDGWVTGDEHDCYYHPFTGPPDGSPAELIGAWQDLAPGLPFAFAANSQAAACAAHLAPRQSAMPPFAGALNYAYHLDAAKLAALLSRRAVGELGVKHIADEVIGVEPDDSGHIAAVATRDSGRVTGDLFIDCSGHSALLIGQHFNTAWVDRGDILFNDRALASQIPVDAQSAIESQTIGTAHEGGWLWDIGLPTRRGIGCVYASRFMDDEAAEKVLRDYVARVVSPSAADAMTPRKLTFPTGHREAFWRGNCLAVGLSAGFIEPLEASAIVMIELSLKALIDNFPATTAALPIHADRFNALFRMRWERIVEFLKLHYVLSRRTGPYWLAHRNPASVPERLATLIDLWRDQPPSAYDFPLAEEIFPAASYQYVYYGMDGAVPDRLPPASEAMRRQFDQVRQRTRGLLTALPTNRALLNAAAAGFRSKEQVLS